MLYIVIVMDYQYDLYQFIKAQSLPLHCVTIKMTLDDTFPNYSGFILLYAEWK